jgi:uncharacterized LabA/DUF88 family protein
MRENGVEVIGIGESKAPVSLRNVCNRFILIENIVSVEKETEKPQKTGKTEQVASDRQPPSGAIPLVIKAMNSIDPEGEWFSLGQLGQYITRASPDFDPRTYGSPKLSDLLEKTGRFEIKKAQGRNVEVRRLD